MSNDFQYCQGDTIVERREYVRDIYANNNTYTNTTPPAATAINYLIQEVLPINPGLPTSFPWLSQIAANYTMYEFHILEYEFESSCTEIGASTNGQVGDVGLCTNYNVNACPYNDKEDFLQAYGAVSAKVTDDFTHVVNCVERVEVPKARFTRKLKLNPRQDGNDYDLGRLNIALMNIPSGTFNQLLGKLYVNYKVILKKPMLQSSHGKSVLQDTYVSCNSSIPTAYPMGNTTTGLLRGFYNNIGTQVAATGPNEVSIYFPPYVNGNFEITFNTCILGNVASLNSTTNSGYIQPTVVSGPITLISDMYGLGPQTTTGTAVYTGRAQASASITGNGTLAYIAHILVKSPDPGSNSPYGIFRLRVDPTVLTITSSPLAIQYPTIIIRNYNASLSSAANNADQNGQNNSPTLANSAGSLIVASATLPPFSAVPVSEYYTVDGQGVLVM